MGKNSQGSFVLEILDENVKNDGSESSSPCYSSKEYRKPYDLGVHGLFLV